MTPPPPELGKQTQVSAIKETNTLSANKETDIIRNYNLPLTRQIMQNYQQNK